MQDDRTLLTRVSMKNGAFVLSRKPKESRGGGLHHARPPKLPQFVVFPTFAASRWTLTDPEAPAGQDDGEDEQRRTRERLDLPPFLPLLPLRFPARPLLLGGPYPRSREGL